MKHRPAQAGESPPLSPERFKATPEFRKFKATMRRLLKVTKAPIKERFPVNDAGWLTFFNNLYIIGTLIALLFGVIALVASNGIRVYSGRTGKAQDKLIADAKERASKADER